MKETILRCDLCGNVISESKRGRCITLDCPNEVELQAGAPGSRQICNLEVEITVTGLQRNPAPNEAETLNLDVCESCTRAHALLALNTAEEGEPSTFMLLPRPELEAIFGQSEHNSDNCVNCNLIRNATARLLGE